MEDLPVLYRRRSSLLTNLELLERERAKVKEAEERKTIAERRRLVVSKRKEKRKEERSDPLRLVSPETN